MGRCAPSPGLGYPPGRAPLRAVLAGRVSPDLQAGGLHVTPGAPAAGAAPAGPHHLPPGFQVGLTLIRHWPSLPLQPPPPRLPDHPYSDSPVPPATKKSKIG
ncbi:hypothetical protein VULLAG_LOCUS8479 [Vulpes lagopus]